MDAAGELDVLGHDGDALGMDGAEVDVLVHVVTLSQAPPPIARPNPPTHRTSLRPSAPPLPPAGAAPADLRARAACPRGPPDLRRSTPARPPAGAAPTTLRTSAPATQRRDK